VVPSESLSAPGVCGIICCISRICPSCHPRFTIPLVENVPTLHSLCVHDPKVSTAFIRALLLHYIIRVLYMCAWPSSQRDCTRAMYPTQYPRLWYHERAADWPECTGSSKTHPHPRNIYTSQDRPLLASSSPVHTLNRTYAPAAIEPGVGRTRCHD
jgi:hypothetical protein